jgi:hypothetical protein
MERYRFESLAGFNQFAGKIEPASVKMQIAFDRAVINCFAFFVGVDSKFSQETSEFIRKSLGSCGDEIAAARASALFCSALLQLSIGGQGCVPIMPDEWSPRRSSVMLTLLSSHLKFIPLISYQVELQYREALEQLRRPSPHDNALPVHAARYCEMCSTRPGERIG